MAHPSKFVSVNLNKSYGQPTNPSYSSRARTGPHSGSSGGGGLVVLSRPRSSSSSASGQKSSMPKLSVPPPLNLPSLRKENEKFDLSSSSGSSARPGSSGIGSGSGSSSMGWTKPAPVLLQEKEAPAQASGRSGSSSYMPPSARETGQAIPPSSSGPVAEKTVFLRGEDFPSLKATVTSGSSNKKDLSKEKEKEKEKVKEDERERTGFHSPLRMRPQMRSSRLTTSNVTDSDDSGLSRGSEQPQKKQTPQEKYFPGPLPLVKLTHTSDWADDERDTGLSLPERDRGFPRTEFSRVHDHNVDLGSVPSRDLYKGDSFGRGDLVGSNKDGRDVASSWRTQLPSQPRDDRAAAKPFWVGREVNRDSSFSHSPYGNNARDGLGNGSPDSRYTRRDLSFGLNNQNGRNEGFSGRGSEQQSARDGRYGEISNNRYRGDIFQQNAVTKAPFSTKGLPLTDPILNFGREKRLNSSSSGKTYLGDAGFDGSDPFEDDPFADVSMKAFKRKKDVQKQVDFHDPVRESFEAELERVQRIQEQERQRAIEEQTRAMEIARREQEERERLVREEEERRRLMEEEAREAAWRAEQERMEAARRVEEQKIAREEEKRRMLMEEERRKEAAKQKLMELEARIARRQMEPDQKDDKLPSAVSDERATGIVMERDVPKTVADVGDWEDGERMVEHLMSTASDSSLNRYIDTGSARFPFTRDTGSSFIDRGRHGNYWKRDAFDNETSSVFYQQDHDTDYRNLRRDTFNPSRGFPRKDGYGGFGAPPMRPPSKGGASEHCSAPDDFRYLRGNRWNVGGEGDHFTRNLEVDAADFLDSDRFGDGGWGSSRPCGSPNAPFADRSFQNSEVDGGFPSYGRSRHSLRQPRVLPPPSISSIRQSSFRGTPDHPISSSFLDNQSRYQHDGRSEGEIMQSGYDGGYEQRVQQPKTPDVIENDVIPPEQKEKDSLRCASQSSLSVSNPPSSPTQLSHDELDDAEDCHTLQTPTLEEQTVLSDSEQSGLEVENLNRMVTASSISHGEDDEWAIENNEEMQEQEEYDDEENGYQEEEETAHDGDGGRNLDLHREFCGPASEVPDVTHEMGQLVLGFDEGVEVSIPMDDDLEKTSGSLENAVQKELVGDIKLQVDSSLTIESISESSKSICETEKALQGSLLEPVASSTGNPSKSSELTSVPGALNQQPIAAPLKSPALSESTLQPISSTVSTVDRQTEAPIRLQFGPFSGPSLMPSPIPAIQIGSIQMPLHLYPQVGTPITQMHPPGPPFFQFGQLQYPPPISQGILPLAPQTVSFVHPPASAQYHSTQNIVGSQNNQASQDSSSQNIPSDKLSSDPIEEQTDQVRKPLDLPEGNANFGHLNELSNPPNSEVASQSQAEINGYKNRRQASGYQNDRHIIRNISSGKNYRSMINNRESQLYSGDFPPDLSLGEKGQTGIRVPVSNSRGRRFDYTVRNAGARSQFSMPENSRTESNMFQRRPRRSVRRTEFRVRDNGDKRQREGVDNNNSTCQETRPSFSGRAPGHSSRYDIKKDVSSNKSTKDVTESENAGASSSRFPSFDGKIEVKLPGKEAPSKKRVSSLKNSHADGDNGKKNVISEEDVDAPLQSGIVRIFKQPGIEAPSDEDDFIEVRSKRQMLIDRREQREKEIKAESRVIKAPRKHRAFLQNNVVTSTPNKVITASGRNTSYRVRSDPVIAGGRGFARGDASPVFTANMASQTLPPIGTPSVKTDSDRRSNNLKSSQANTMSVPSSGAAKFVPGSTFDSESTGLVNASLSLGSWSNPDINQQVMALTQSQLDDAMNPVQFDSQVASSITLEPTKLPSSVVAQEKTFPSSESPLNSLLAGERIQFGAVTSPSILPPVSRTVSSGIGPPGSSRSDVSKDNMATTNNDSTIFFDKDKFSDEACPHLEDPESEAEAAASAVAVAAISNSDEIIGNRLSACSIPDSKGFSGVDNSELKSSGGMTSSQEVTGQSAAEESLTVALPADLSVDTPALPLWHPLPSPQSTSGPTLSHFPGGPHSHFPMGFDMNPMFGGPIFAFGPHDESGGTQSQQQRSTTLGSGPLGAWPQCHSGVDSFYGPPAGFAGPYISPPGGIPGVQAPPHMVVYNHFAPVGQFGQVGLGFMGATYIPQGKQPDWKHNPASSSTLGVSEGDMSTGNVVSGQRKPPNMPSPTQHLAPGSSLMPMASPLPMFDISPFQSSADMPYQARWSHVPAPPIHSVPLTMPLHHQQQSAPLQVEGRIPSQFSRSLPMDTSTTKDRFNDPQASTSGDGSRSLTLPNDAACQFPDQLRLVEQPSVSNPSVQTISSHNPAVSSKSRSSNNSKSSSRSAVGGASEGIGGGGGGQNTTSSFKPQGSQQQSASSGQQQYLHPIGHGDKRGTSQKTGSSSEWHRRMGRGQGSDKGFAPSKMKQIYVAKSPISGPARKD